MLVQVNKKFESENPHTQVIGSLVDASEWPNLNALVESGYVSIPDAKNVGSGTDEARFAALEVQIETLKSAVLATGNKKATAILTPEQ